MRRAVSAPLRRGHQSWSPSSHRTALEVGSSLLFFPSPHRLKFSDGYTPLLQNKGFSSSTPLRSPALKPERSCHPRHGLLLPLERVPFSTSSAPCSAHQSTSPCSNGGERSKTELEEFDADAVSAVCRSVISRFHHLWKKNNNKKKKVGTFDEGSSLLDVVRLSIDLSPETMRRFWRVSALMPEDVLEILMGFGPKVGKREVDFLLNLFIWAGEQTGDFCHLPKSYVMMISMLIRARMLREAESLLLEIQARRVFVLGLSGFFSEIIRGYVDTCDLKSSIALYDQARCCHGVVLTVSCYQALLRWLVKMEKAELVQRVYMDMVDLGIVSSNENSALDFIVQALCRNGKVLEPVNLLRRLRNSGIECSCLSLDMVADAYCKKGDFEDLLNFLKEWEQMPSTYICNKILSSLCRASGSDEARLFMQNMVVLGFEADAKTFEIFIRWSCQEGRLRNAFIYLSELFSRMLKPDVHVYNAILGGVFKEGISEFAKDVYTDMVEKEIMPDMSTFRVILAGYCKERKFDEVTHILGEMVNRGFVSLSSSDDALSKAFTVLGLDCLCVKVKRDNNMLFPKAEFFDSLGNGLYLDTDLVMYEKILTRLLDDAMFPDFDLVVQEKCSKCEMETALMLKDEAVQHGHILSFSTYSKLLEGLMTSRSFIKKAVNLLEEIPDLCSHLDHHTLNLLLQAFSKNGILVKMKQILDVLSQRELSVEADTCTAIIMAFCKGKDLNEFQEFWGGPQRKSWIPEFEHMGFLLRYLLKWEMFQEVCELFESMSLKYPQLIPAICNAFVKEFCNAGFMTVGCVFVDEVLRKGLVLKHTTYECLITGLCREKKFTEAFHVLDLMLGKNVTPSASLCQLLVPMLFRSSGMEKAMSLKWFMWSKESETPFPLHDVLLKELPRIGRITKVSPELQKLHVGVFCPIQSILDIMIQKHSQEKNFRTAFQLLCLILKLNMHLGMSTFRNLVRLTCSIGHVHVALNLKDLMLREYGFHPNTIYNIIIFYLLQEGNCSSLDVILDDMRQQVCNPDQTSYNFLVHGYFKCDDAEKSVNLLKTMISKNLQPSNRSLRTVISYLCNHLRLNEALELWQTMENKRWKHGSAVQTMLVGSLLSHGRLHEAELLLGRLEDKNLIPDKANYDILIKCFCRIGRVNTALHLLNLMLKKGDLPSENSYNVILQKLLIRKAFDEALDIHMEMLHNKMQPSMESYDMLVHRLCGAGRTGDAENLLDAMLVSGQVPTSSLFRVVIDRYHSVNDLSKASLLLDKMQQYGRLPDFETHWSFISNLNSVNNNKDDNGKGFLSNLLSQTGFPTKGSKNKGESTAHKPTFLP